MVGQRKLFYYFHITFSRWLARDVDRSAMPPPRTIKGFSYILYEGLRVHCQTRIFLYPLSKLGTYNARQVSTLGVEQLFGELTLNTPGGLRPTTTAVENFLSDASLLQLIRSDTRRYNYTFFQLGTYHTLLNIKFIIMVFQKRW